MTHTLARTGLLAALLIAALAAGCGGCKSAAPSKSTPAGFFPQSTPAFITLVDPERGSDALRKLDGMKITDLAKLAMGADEEEDLLQPLVRQLGFDPRGQEGFALVGIDRRKGMAVGEDAAKRPLFVVGISDKRAAERWVAELAKRQGGLTKTERTWANEKTEKALRVPAFIGSDGKVRVAYVIEGGWMAASLGEEAVAAVGEALAREEGDSLAKTQAFAALQKKIGPDRTIWGWAPAKEKKRSRVRRGRGGLLDGGYTFGLTLAEDGIDARLLIAQGPLQASVLQAAANEVAGAELLPFLSEDDFLVTRIGGDPMALRPLLQALFPSTYRQLRRAGLDPGEAILAHLKPGVVIGLALEPEPNLSGGLPVQPSLSTTNPFHFIHSGMVATVKNPKEVKAMLVRLAEAGERLRMEVEVTEQDGLEVYSASYQAGDGLTWALVGDKIIAAGGEGAFAKLLARVQGEVAPYQPKDPEAWELFEAGASAMHLDVPLLVGQLEAIPSSSFGIGGFRLKEVMMGWTTLLEEIQGITVAFQVDGDGLLFDAKVGLE